MNSSSKLAGLAVLLLAGLVMFGDSQTPIHFHLQTLPFVLDGNESKSRNAPETMAGGVAVLDYNHDGRPDIYFTNGANLATLEKDAPRFTNRLYRNEGGGRFTDVTAAAGVGGSGFDTGVAVGDYDNDGWPDLLVTGVGQMTLFHNNHDGTFADMTAAAGLSQKPDPQYGSLWGVAAAWVDVNNDGLLDLFVVDYLQWTYDVKPLCSYHDVPDYCHPRFYQGQPNRLYLNRGAGHFQDASEAWGLRKYVGKGMGVGVADFDGDGRPDLFVPNDTYYNALFRNMGDHFEDVAMEAGVALAEDGNFISGMGLDFRDVDNDGHPDIAYVALNSQTFPLLRNTGKGDFRDITTETGIRKQSMPMAGFGALLYDFDNDGWKDLFVTRGHVSSITQPGTAVDQPNTVFRNGGSANAHWTALTGEAGLTASEPARHRGCAAGDFDGDGKPDLVVTALGRNAEIWENDSSGNAHWLDVALEGTKSNRDGIGASIKVVSKGLTQYNHRSTSVCYASSSDAPVHFGLGGDVSARSVEIHWPSGVVQTLNDVRADQVVRAVEPK